MEFLSLLYTVLLVAICLQQALLLYRSGKPAPRQDDEALKEWVRQQLDAQSKLFAQKQAELARQNYDAMRGISETLQTAVQGMSSTLNAGQAAQQQTMEQRLQGLEASNARKLEDKGFRYSYDMLGEAALTADQYAAFCAAVCASGCADLLDIEFFSAGERLPQWIAAAHAAGVKVVCSSHDFQKTPPRAELVERMVRMQQAGADLPKLAVMPTCRTDVLELLAATAEMADHHPETPVITMSMGALGAVSRLCGEAFGSAMTFANPGTASAPGQVPLDVVDAVLDSLRLS